MIVPRLVVLASFVAACSACTPVPAWQRAHFARGCMRSSGDLALSRAYDAKLTESLTAGGASGEAPSGGCACAR